MLLDAPRRLPHATALSICAVNALARRALRLANPIVRATLSSPAHRPLSGVLLVLSYSGRRSGRTHSLPLQYAHYGDKLVVMSGTASQKAWWRNFREPARVSVTLAGKQQPWTAHVLSGRERDEARAAYSARFRRMNTREDVEFVGLSALIRQAAAAGRARRARCGPARGNAPRCSPRTGCRAMDGPRS